MNGRPESQNRIIALILLHSRIFSTQITRANCGGFCGKLFTTACVQAREIRQYLGPQRMIVSLKAPAPLPGGDRGGSGKTWRACLL